MSARKNRIVFQVKGSHLIAQDLGDELVVFNKSTNTAHLLDPQAASIFKAAANGCSIEDAVGLVGAGTDAQPTAAAALAIADLATAGVIESLAPPVSRRSLLRTLGAAAATPMVISILAPTPAAAMSNLPLQAQCFPNDTCALDAICDLGVCCLPLGFGDCNTDLDCCQNLTCFHPVGPGPNPGTCQTRFVT